MPTPEPRSELRIAAIVLAAGSSRRFGEANKLLTFVDGEPLLRRVVRAALASRAAPVLVVTGHQRIEIERALTGLAVTFTHNPRHAEGMGTSLAHAFATVLRSDPPVDGAMVLLGDMPDVGAVTLDRLIEAFVADGARRITFPVDRSGQQRNPVLWPRALFQSLIRLDGDRGGRDLIAADATMTLAVPMGDGTGVVDDIDTPQALEAWLQRQRGA